MDGLATGTNRAQHVLVANRSTGFFRVGCLAVVLVALALRLTYLAELAQTPFADERALISDARFYDLRAVEIAAGDVIGKEPGYLSPVYCYFLGGLYALFGPGLWTAKLGQAVLGALTCGLVASIGRRVFDERAGLLAGVLFACYPLHVYYTGLVLPTVTVTFVNLLFVALLLPGSRGFTPARTLAAGLALGLAIGAKPNALLALPMAAAWLFFALRAGGTKRVLVHAGLLALGAFVAVAPITWRNHTISGQLVPVSVVGGRNLMKGNGPAANGSHVFLPAGQQGVSLHVILERDIDAGIAVEDDRRMRRAARDYALEHPWRTVKLGLRKAYLFFNAHELGIRDQFAFARASFRTLGWNPLVFGLLVPIGLLGALSALRRGPAAWLLHGMLLVQLASFVIVFVLARYRLVAVACLFVFAAAQILYWFDALRAGAGREVLPSLLLTLPIAVFVNAPSGFARERGFADQYAFVAHARFVEQDYASALAAYQSVVDASWQNARAHFADDALWERIALCHQHLTQPAEAERAAREALRLAAELPPKPAARRTAEIRAALSENGIVVGD